MDKSHQQAQETRKKNRAAQEARRAQEEAEIRRQIAALRIVRDHPDSTPTERLEAVNRLAEYKKQYSWIL